MSSEQLKDSVGDFDVAIIGMSGRFPGAKSVSEFWHNLRDGIESISFFSPEEMEAAGVDPSVVRDPHFVRAGGVLDEVDGFDAAFFDMNPREVELMDPQHRLFLECAWEALEDACYNSATYQGLIGVFGGVSFHPYLWSNWRDDSHQYLDGHLLKIALSGSLTGRVSYKLNLTGPSVTIQSGCSTSLVAVHLACQSLLNYECDIALAGGVSIDTFHKGYFVQEGALSPDGHTRAFDEQAGGVVGGNGVGIVTLKKLSGALSDGDHIYAVIRGSAINNDGSLKTGYTAPSVQGQTRVILAAQSVSGVAADTIGYVETHGTATPLGDSIEIKALTEAFRTSTDRKQFCAVGSVKTNIGHLDNAAGVAGLIKTALSLKHKLLPPSLHFNRPNPEIKFESSPFYVNHVLSEWKAGRHPRRAAVSSFGIGGTNAHVILEEAREQPAPAPARSRQLLILSAKSETALDAQTANLVDHLKQCPDANLADVAYSLQVGRRAFTYRRTLVCREVEDAVAALESLAPQRVFDSRQEPVERPLAFMFPGGGAQYFQMGLGLYREERVFREQFDSCAEILLPELGRDIRKVLYPDAAQIEAARAQFAEPPCIMATVFVVEYALARLLMSWGLQPEAMIGHSFGEYVAACLSGVFTLRDALRLIALRGQLFDKMDEGAMLSVPLPGDEVSDMFGEHLSIAAVNGPSRCVVSGRPEAVAALEAKLAGMKVSCSRMQANRAGHSEMVEPILKPFSGYLSTLRLQSPNIPFISNVTGTWITASEATSVDYWVRHLRQTVQFGQGIRELVKEPARILFEVGPGQTLSSLARRQLADKRTQLTLPSLRDQAAEISDVEFLLSALGKLWLAGVRPDWAGFHQTEKRQRLSLPTYHFERQRYWKEPKRQAAQTAARSSSPSAGDETTNLHVPVWKRSLASPATPRTRFEPPRQKYLIFTDECGLGERLAGRLKEENHSVISVRPGDGFRRLSDDLYTLNPRTAADYPKLFDDLRAEGSLPSQILHLWSVDRSVADSSRGDACEFFEETQRASSDSLWQIAQAIGGHHDTDAIQLLVISTGVQAVTGEEQLKPAKATLLGACTSIPLKFSNINCRSVDISLPREFGEAGESRLVGQLINEINCECRDTFVGYRGAYRWLQEYEELRADVLSSEKPELRAGGVYLAANGVEESSLWLVEHAAKIVGGKWVFVIPPDVELPHGFARLNDYGRDANVSREFPTAAARTKAAARIDLKIDGEIEHIARLEEAFDRDANVKTVESYTGLTEGLNRLCLSYLCEFLVRQYPAIGRGRTMSRAELESSVGVTPEFKHLWDVCVNVLSHDGVIRADERSVEFLKDPQEMADPEQLREALDQTYPDFSASFWLVQHCIRSYGKIFSGEITANNVLYPDGSYEMLNNLARQSVETTKSRVYRSLLAAVVTHIAQKSDRTLRILEVGAGTGILTWDVVAALKQLNVEYYFTDIGKAFVVRAQREATEKGLAGMRFGTLDISREPSAQGFEKYGFDMILGFDVVQATRNIEQTLTHLKDLLAPHGVLFLLQTLRVYRWQHLTFGLSPGWWNYRNDPLRGASPVLSLNEWEAVLKGQGFESVSSYPLKGEEKANAGFGMIVAQRPAEINHEEILERSPDGHRERDGLKQDIVSRLDALKVLGAEVYLAQADQTSVEQLKDVVAQVQARFNELNGVFYTAESYSETGKAEEPLPDAASPAIRSLYALRDALHDRHPNFCLLASSPAGFEATQANFAAASTNCFLEALVSERNMSDADGCWKSLRLNLEPAAGNPTVTPILAPSKIEEALKYVLGLRQVSHAVLRTEDGLGQGAQVSSDAHARGQQEQSVARTAGERASIQSSDTGADDHVAQALTAIWRDLLGVAYVGRHDNFFDLGGDSLIALQLISRLRDSLHVNVSVTELFDKQTIETLAEFIAQRLSAASPSAETAHGVLTMERGDGDIDQLLNRLEQLSDEEIQSLLREDKNV